MDRNVIVVLDFAALFTWCCMYAWVLHRRAVRHWYITHNKTWFVLVLGVVFVLAALAALIPFGVIDRVSWSLFVLAFCVGGAPMVVGQLIQDARNRALHDARKENHDENSRR